MSKDFELEYTEQASAAAAGMEGLTRDFFGISHLSNSDTIAFICHCSVKNLYYPLSQRGKLFHVCSCGREFLLIWEKFVEYKDEESAVPKPYSLSVVNTKTGDKISSQYCAFFTKEGDGQTWRAVLI